MKFLIEARLSTEIVSKKLMDGTMMKDLKTYLTDARPEVVYFSLSHGKRTLFMVVNIPSGEKMPELAEPLWLDYGAEVYATAVMDASDFEKAGSGIQKIIKNRM